MKSVRYALEAILLGLLFIVFRILPVSAASNIGGWIGRMVGPRLAASRKAMRNIEAALPELTPAQHQEAITQMWDNLGRVIAEYPHLKTIGNHRSTLGGADILEDLIMQEQPAVFFGAHQGNWEVNGALLHQQYGQPVDITYREPNNPWSAALLKRARTLNGRLGVIAKSRTAGKALIMALKNKRNIGVLLDQKYNEGVALPFFGRDAMTNPSFVSLCQKYKCPLVPVRNIRRDNTRFELSLHEPIELFDEDGASRSAEDVMREANALMESWIREYPGQWLWLHRRWDSKALNN